MKPTDLDRYGCALGGRRLTYQVVLQRYVCDECGGKLSHSFVGGDRVFCPTCGGEDIISESKYLQQVAEGYEVLQSLPDDLRALLEETEKPQMDAKQAIKDLFGG